MLHFFTKTRTKYVNNYVYALSHRFSDAFFAISAPRSGVIYLARAALLANGFCVRVLAAVNGRAWFLAGGDAHDLHGVGKPQRIKPISRMPSSGDE